MLVDTGISFDLGFSALKTVNAAVSQIAGYDIWRQPTGAKRLQLVDRQLAREIVFAPSKKAGNPNSAWSKIHFSLLLSGLRNIPQHQDFAGLENRFVTAAEAKEYFLFFDDLRSHIDEYIQLRDAMNLLRDSFSEGKSTLQDVFSGLTAKLGESSIGYLFRGLSLTIGSRHGEFEAKLRELPKDGKQDFSASGAMRLLLPFLPEHPDALGTIGQRILVRASEENDLICRIVLSYFADHKAVSYVSLGIPAIAKTYFNESLHERLLKYLDSIEDCPLMAEKEALDDKVSLAALLLLYCRWYQNPYVVEMISSGFAGAAEPGAERIVSLLDYTARLTGAADLRNIHLARDKWALLQEDDDFCYRLGRLMMVIGAIGNPAGPRHKMDSAPLQKMALLIWSAQKREALWGIPQGYIPTGNRGANDLQQDVMTILCALACNIGDHASLLGDDVFAASTAAVSALEEKISQVTADQEVLEIFHAERGRVDLICQTARQISRLDPGSRHSHDAISYLRRYLGAETVHPAEVGIGDLVKGIGKLSLAEKDGLFSFAYQERGQRTELQLAVPAGKPGLSARYIAGPFAEDGLIYPARYEIYGPAKNLLGVCPVVGRQSYDPLGKTGEEHGGEVIGYGCSVHHASLQLILVLGALAGLQREGLAEISEAFARVNPEYRHRHTLATYQVQRLAAILENHVPPSYARWLEAEIAQGRIVLGYGHAHTSRYLKDGHASLPKEYYIRLARLSATHRDLYPFDPGKAVLIDPRSAWYEEETGNLPTISGHVSADDIFRHFPLTESWKAGENRSAAL